jgi:septum formation protein
VLEAAQPKIYLASRSPRRRELLDQVGIDYDVLTCREDVRRGADVDETPLAQEPARDYVLRLACAKAQSAWQRVGERKLARYPVLAADTTVVLGKRIIGKPADREQAMQILRQLSGRRHQVLSAVAVCRAQALATALSASTVEFKVLTEAEIRDYCATAEPLDKAGAYAAQGRAAAFIRKLSGSYSGVVGLPLYETVQLLREFGIGAA